MSSTNIPKITINIGDGSCCRTCTKPLIVPVDSGGCGCLAPTSFQYEPNSPCKECEAPCDDSLLLSCMFFDIAGIPQLGIKQNDPMAKVIIILAAEIIELKKRLAAANIA